MSMFSHTVNKYTFFFKVLLSDGVTSQTDKKLSVVEGDFYRYKKGGGGVVRWGRCTYQ